MSLITASNADEWRDLASESFVPLSVQRAAKNFRAAMDFRVLAPGVSISRIKTQALIIDRTLSLASHAESDDVHISLQVNARGSISQNGNLTPVGPGVVTLCETHRPFTLNYVDPNQEHIVLQVSRDALGVEAETIRNLSGRALTGRNAARTAYASFVTSLTSEAPAPADADTAGVVTTLAAAMLRSAVSEEPTWHESDIALYMSMCSYISVNISHAQLSPDTIAAAHHVSRRKMYGVFEQFGETPASVIRACRLEEAARRLVDDGWNHHSIADVALSVGFGDVTTFTRAFVRHFGYRPRDWRRHIS